MNVNTQNNNRVSVTLTLEEHALLTKLAGDDNRQPGNLAAHIVKLYLDKYKEKKE